MNTPLVAHHHLSGSLSIYEMETLKPQLLAWLEASPELEIDLSGIECIDASGLQLLAMLKQESLRRQQVLRLTGHAPCVQVLFQQLNVVAFFGDPLILSAKDRDRRTEEA